MRDAFGIERSDISKASTSDRAQQKERQSNRALGLATITGASSVGTGYAAGMALNERDRAIAAGKAARQKARSAGFAVSRGDRVEAALKRSRAKGYRLESRAAAQSAKLHGKWAAGLGATALGTGVGAEYLRRKSIKD